MLLEISSKELLAGTRAYRRNHPEEKEQRLAWLRRERSANASFDEPDVKEFLNVYGIDLLEAVASENDLYNLLARCSTPIDRSEVQFWLNQLKNPESRRALYSLFNDDVVMLYCLVGGKNILSFTTGRSFFRESTFHIYPSDSRSTDFLAEDSEEVVDFDRICDPADYNHILSAIFAEWMYGRPKSATARDFICTACERAENS